MNFLQLKLFMATYDLFAFVKISRWETDRVTGEPRVMYYPEQCQRVRVANYPTKLLAQWWGINIARVYIDAAKTILVPTHQIVRFEIIEVP